jgi:hypothetical protein
MGGFRLIPGHVPAIKKTWGNDRAGTKVSPWKRHVRTNEIAGRDGADLAKVLGGLAADFSD